MTTNNNSPQSHGEAHAHDHPAYLAHHFMDMEQQTSAGKLGMWLFLGQELLFFSGLFLAYTIGRFFYPETFLAAHELLDWRMGAINTVVLLTSSLTMALAVRGAQTNNMKALNWNVIATFLLAGVFLVIKYFEYMQKIHHGYLPGKFFHGMDHEGMPIPGAPGVFFAIYWIMTGTHGLHVIIGMGVMIWLLLRARKGEFNSENYGFVENTGLYWHLVDLIWIFLFPLLYLVR